MRKKEELSYIKKYSDRREKNLRYDFMPDLLEIIERPAHIGGRIIIWTVFCLVISLIVWASLSKVDVIATATGTVNPKGSISNLQVRADGVISEVTVHNGELVERDEVLLRQDTTLIDIDIQSIEKSMRLLEEENKIYNMVINEEDLSVINPENYSEDIRNDINYILRQENYYTKLNADNDENENLKEQHNITTLGKIVDNEKELEQLKDSLHKVEEDLENSELKADTEGYVTNLSDGLEGTIVTAGTNILSIVPKDSVMEIQCYVANRDIADLELGKEAIIKLEAYPYSDYGTLKGRINYISASAISTDKMMNVYVVKLEVENHNEDIVLMPGLTATVEFKLGKRSIMEYFLEPVTGALKNSIKEK